MTPIIALACAVTVLTAVWPELCRGTMLLAAAIRRETADSRDRQRQRSAMHAMIVSAYVRSGDTNGLITYLGASQTYSAAGQVIPVPRTQYARFPGPCLRHGWCGDYWCPQCDPRAYSGT